MLKLKRSVQAPEVTVLISLVGRCLIFGFFLFILFLSVLVAQPFRTNA